MRVRLLLFSIPRAFRVQYHILLIFGTCNKNLCERGHIDQPESVYECVSPTQQYSVITSQPGHHRAHGCHLHALLSRSSLAEGWYVSFLRSTSRSLHLPLSTGPLSFKSTWRLQHLPLSLHGLVTIKRISRRAWNFFFSYCTVLGRRRSKQKKCQQHSAPLRETRVAPQK